MDVDWYCLRNNLNEDAADLFVSTAARLLPEALPRRYGEYEPLQGKYADGGAGGFLAAWEASTSSLLMSGSAPCISGSLGAGANATYADKFWSMSLTLLAEPLREPAWRDSLRALFTALADGLPAFYASAEVTGGWLWAGRSLWSDGETEHRIVPVRYLDGWMGLPPSTPWWSWFGGLFPEAATSLPTRQVVRTERGVLFQAADEPTGATGLEPMTRWLAGEIFAQLAPNPRGGQPTPLIRATRVPPALA